jgi:hypothetical protein
MMDSRDRKIFTRVCALGALSACLWHFSGNASTRNRAQAGRQIPISTQQLPPTNGKAAVELKCGDAELSAPNKIENFPCSVVNNTSKRISAMSVAYSITVEDGGGESSHTEALTLDTFIHPDLREERKDNLIPPGAERPFRPLPTSFDDAVVKAISMQVDYVEFEDGSSLGPNESGSRIIDGIREGAAKYRNWLMGKYNSSGKSAGAMTSLIQDDPLPEDELGIKSAAQEQGAVIYRNFLRDSYGAKGLEHLSKFLERKASAEDKWGGKR